MGSHYPAQGRERPESTPRGPPRRGVRRGQNSGLRSGCRRRPTLYVTGRSTHGLYAFLSSSRESARVLGWLTTPFRMGSTQRPLALDHAPEAVERPAGGIPHGAHGPDPLRYPPGRARTSAPVQRVRGSLFSVPRGPFSECHLQQQVCLDPNHNLNGSVSGTCHLPPAPRCFYWIGALRRASRIANRNQNGFEAKVEGSKGSARPMSASSIISTSRANPWS